MKRCIRISVFETNSSSVDTLSINRKHRGYLFDIPRDTEVRVWGLIKDKTCYFDEMSKLNMILAILETIYMRHHPEFEKYNEPENPEMLYTKMVTSDWFVWLAEVIKEESNSEIIYEPPKLKDGFGVEWYHPFYGIVYDSSHSAEEIFTADNPCILLDKKLFKKHVKTIIYDPDVFINKYTTSL